MTGIFYDHQLRTVRRVQGTPDPAWAFVTHNVAASANHCRRIMSEWLATEDLFMVDWSGIQAPVARSA